MSQQINLMHAGLQRRTEPFNSVHAALAVVAAALLTAGAAGLLHMQSARSAAQAGTIESDFNALQARAADVGAGQIASQQAAELQRLRRAEASQRQLRAAIDSGNVGSTQGYAQYFTALARQSQPTLWITGFAVAADGAALELQGRMADPRMLPDYLRRLNTEPLFKGREFAQLSLKAVEASAAGPGGYTEFALRGLPAASEPGR
jgi:Fimbrial assembly protein (PilN)